MRWIIAVLGLALAGSVQAGFAPRYVTDLPCGSDIRLVQDYELQPHSTEEFLAAYNKMPCNTNVMIEALYVYGGHEPPDTSSMFDARINPPANTLDTTQQEYYRNRKDIDHGIAYSWDLLRSKKYDKAIFVLEDLYATASSAPITPPFEQRKDFQRHIIAKQLAYAHELNGNAKKALEWAQIHQSLAPTRMGWLHVAVLENKLQYQNSQQPISSILNLPFRKDGFLVPRIDLNIQGEPASLRQMIDTTAAFLYERVELYPNNDTATSSLLFDLGHLVALTGSYEDAQYVLNLSKMYGDTNANSAQTYFQFKEIGHHGVDWLLFVVAGVALLGAWMVFAWLYGVCLRYRARQQGRKAIFGTLVLGTLMGGLGCGFLIGLAAWFLSLSSTTGQAPSWMEAIVFGGIILGAVVGMVVAWSRILRPEINAIGVARHWLQIGLGLVWIVGWMCVSVLSAVSSNPNQLMFNEVLPIILMLPVVAGFVLWVNRLRNPKIRPDA